MSAAAIIAASHWRDVQRRDWPFAYFSPHELASRGNGAVCTVIAAGERLDALRRLLGKPLVVSSAYRDPLHNARVGGAPLSRHKAGDAADILAGGIPRRELLAAAENCGFTGIGLYRTFIHLDCRPLRPLTRPGKSGPGRAESKTTPQPPVRWFSGGRRTLELWT